MSRFGLMGMMIVGACGPKAAPPQAPAAPAVEVAWFEPEGARCGWYRGGPGQPPTRLADLPEPCDGSVAFALRGDDALVQLTHVWRVRLSTGAVTDLGAPPVGDLAQVGLDASGQPLAYTLGGGTYTNPERFEGPITFEGQAWSTAGVTEGLAVLAHAFEWTDGWRRIESKVVSSGWDYAEDQRGLEAHRRLASIASEDLWREHVGDAERVEVDGAALSAILPVEEPQAGEWHAVQTAGGRLAWWMIPVEWLVTTQQVLREAGGTWAPVPFEGWERFDTPSFQTRGGQVLITQWGSRPRLMDVATGEVLWARPDARAATLWPPPEP